MKKLLFIPCFVFACLTVGHAQKLITVEDFTVRNTFVQRSISGINWMHDGKYYTTLSANAVVKNDVTTGKVIDTIFAGGELKIEAYSFSGDEKKLLVQTEIQKIYRRSYKAEYYVYDITSKSLQRLSPKGKQSYAAFSPDGSRIAFVRDNNLFLTSLADNTETQVTTDGQFNSIINGTTDWVYEEEFGFVDGFCWSPDGSKIAYYRFDETLVREYNLQRWGKTLYPVDYRFKYPKAGEANSSVEIWIYDIVSGKKTKADTGTDEDFYIPRVQWTNNPALLSIRKLNRLQNTLELLHTDVSTGASEVVLKETSSTYVDIKSASLYYLDDGKHFIYLSERDGYAHIYLYSLDGKLVRQITNGKFEVSQLIGVNEKAKTVYYTSTEASPLEKNFYSITLDGKKKARLSPAGGVHNIDMGDDFQFYVDHHSHASQPNVVSLYRTKGNSIVKVLEKNEALTATLKAYGFAPKEYFTFKGADGTTLNGFMLKPPKFDSTKRYPVLMYQYSGPGSQQVANNFTAGHFHFHQMMAQKGYLIVFVDPRGTGGRGEAFKKVTYKQLGKYELEDLIAAAQYLSAQPYVDGNRMAIWGWSYGGYMSALAMTKGAGTFKLGIAVSPVTNWRFYDTVYTERFLQTPQLNASGYDDNSPSTHADKLRGKFLLIHGTGDDNVHLQNSTVLQDALIQAGKEFEAFFYPDKEHSIAGGKTRFHLYTMMSEYIVKNL
ncbi:MAG TPA: DPP IV N-terminal domain-containing protein [Ohtaekwangia sp.]|nr:DPP IV N-terminal domain-containing protein [Ohtaekwangia sp.]